MKCDCPRGGLRRKNHRRLYVREQVVGNRTWAPAVYKWIAIGDICRRCRSIQLKLMEVR